MFLEPVTSNKRGSIEVICGVMFSGKTEELIRRIKRARYAKQKIELFKPAADVRYHPENIVSHNKSELICTPVKSANEILMKGEAADVIGIDEAQFFDITLVNVCNQLANSGKRVIVAGLDMDYSGKPFSPMPELMAIAEYITKLKAICVHCGELAHYSHRKTTDTSLVLIGESSNYEALCRICYNRET